MQADQLHLTQITLEAGLIPMVFRGLFVLFLGLVMLLMNDDEKKSRKNITDYSD